VIKETLIRITHVAPTLFGDDGLFGGGERYPLELARALARHASCKLIGFGPRAGIHRESSGLELCVLRARLHLRGHPAHPIGWGLSGAVADADVVHVHQLRATPGRMTALVSAARRTPVVATDHGLGGGGWFGLLPKMFDHFLAVSHFSARILDVPADKTTIVYGGADPRRFFPDPTIVRRGLAFVGRITPHKGIDVLLRALPPDVRLTVAGTSGHDTGRHREGYSRLLRDLAGDKDVRFTGRVPERALPDLLRGARAFVLPSVYETCYGDRVEISELLGLSVIEAMASGTPVVCSRIGGLPEVVDDGVTGVLVEPGDVHELADAVRRLVTDPEKAERMGRAGRERALELFTWDHCARRCLEVYSMLAEGGPE
jgi:glycosyltransferase involved in cell wall biosynthesis